MITITFQEASALFKKLPREKQLRSLSPEYVIADSARDSSLKPLFFACSAGENFWMHGVHRGGVAGTDFYDLQSPYGYGGPVSNTDDLDFHNEAWKDYTAFCKKNNILAEFVRLHPIGKQVYLGETIENRLTVVMDAKQEFPAECQYTMRKAVASGMYLERHDGSCIKSWGTGYRSSMQRIGASAFYFFPDGYFTALENVPGAILIMARIHSEYIASAIFLEAPGGVEYHLSWTSELGRKHGAMNLIMQQGHRLAQEYQKPFYLGGGKTTMLDDPLLAFKRSFGGELKPFYIGSMIHMPDTYYEMENAAHEISAVNPKVLWWR